MSKDGHTAIILGTASCGTHRKAQQLSGDKDFIGLQIFKSWDDMFENLEVV